jgi:hypothetical protein
VKLQNSNSDFSVYSTNGEQLTGDLSGYNELGHQFDKKRIVFYFEVSDKAIVLGTRLMVQIIGGREERAIFIKKYALSEFSMREDFINRFYDDARTHVENLDQIKYKVLGLLKKGDLPIQECGITISAISAITGKILIREPVKIKIEDLSLSFGALRKIIEVFKQKNIVNYKIAIAQYPVDIDILISPNISDMDLEILNNGEEKVQPIFKKKQPLFQAISETYDRQLIPIRKIDFQDRNTLSRILKNSLLNSETLVEIIKANPKNTQDILDLYRSDTVSLYHILKRIFKYNKTLDGVNKEIIALIVNHVIESIKKPSFEDIDILKIGYITLENDNLKNKIQQYLILNGIFEGYFLKDLFKISIKNSNAQLLKSIIGSQEFDDEKLQILKNNIDIHNFEQNQVLKFIETMFESNFERDSNGKGYQIYLEILNQYKNRQFNTKKLNKLQERYGRSLVPLPQPIIIGERTTIILLILTFIAIIGLILFIFWYFGVFNFIMSGNQTPNETNIIQKASGNPGLLITIINGSVFEVNGNQTDFQGLTKSITMSNATSVHFVYNNTSKDMSISSINNNEALNNFIGNFVKTT